MNTERGYLYTARRWSEWLADQGHHIEPAEVRAHHVDDFVADIIEATSAANGAHHHRLRPDRLLPDAGCRSGLARAG